MATVAGAVVWDAPLDADYPVLYDVPPAGRHSRWKVALRLPLALPHLIALYICFYLAELITIVAWLIGIFSGSYEPGLAALPTACLRWEARLVTYVGLLRDEYPRFTGGDYPMLFDAPLQRRQGRGSIFFRALLVLPHVVVLDMLSTVWLASVALAWFALLISGRYPEGLRRLVIGLNRWMLRVAAYTLLLRGDYPPFSLGLRRDEPTQQFASTVPAATPAQQDAEQQPAFAPIAPTAFPPFEGDEQRTSVAPGQQQGSNEPPLATEPALPTPTIFWPTVRREVTPPAAAESTADNTGSDLTELPAAAVADDATNGGDAPPASRPSFFRPRRDPPPS